MIQSSTAYEIIEKAITLAGSTPDVGLLDLHTGMSGLDKPHSMYFYNRVTKRFCSEGTIVCSDYEGDIDELISLMQEYNNRVQEATNTLLGGEYGWVDAATFRYCYRVGSDYGYCHITKCTN